MRFGAKCSAFWCKMEGVLVLNARQNGAKCKAIKHKNTLKWYKQTPSGHETHGSKGQNIH